MENIKNIALACTITLSLVFGYVLSTKDGNSPTIVNDTTGAVSSPDIQASYFSYAGIRHYGKKTTNLTSATTTVCALQSPAATSTLMYGSIHLTTSSTTASTVTLAKAATAYATTTALGSASVGANAYATVVSKRTAAGGDALDETFAPNTYFVVGMAGNVGTFSPAGTCSAVWIEN